MATAPRSASHRRHTPSRSSRTGAPSLSLRTRSAGRTSRSRGSRASFLAPQNARAGRGAARPPRPPSFPPDTRRACRALALAHGALLAGARAVAHRVHLLVPAADGVARPRRRSPPVRPCHDRSTCPDARRGEHTSAATRTSSREDRTRAASARTRRARRRHFGRERPHATRRSPWDERRRDGDAVARREERAHVLDVVDRGRLTSTFEEPRPSAQTTPCPWPHWRREREEREQRPRRPSRWRRREPHGDGAINGRTPVRGSMDARARGALSEGASRKAVGRGVRETILPLGETCVSLNILPPPRPIGGKVPAAMLDDVQKELVTASARPRV